MYDRIVNQYFALYEHLIELCSFFQQKRSRSFRRICCEDETRREERRRRRWSHTVQSTPR